MEESLLERVQDLSDQTADTYTPDDIIEHLEEELIECLLSIKRIRRGKGTLAEFVEELIDVSFDLNTVLTTLEYNGKDISQISYMRKQKLNKWDSMLNKDERCVGEQQKTRYRPMCEW
jgi:NTP pyrophosphatase (non-canonical NTP hydrolase)